MFIAYYIIVNFLLIGIKNTQIAPIGFDKIILYGYGNSWFNISEGMLLATLKCK